MRPAFSCLAVLAWTVLHAGTFRLNVTAHVKGGEVVSLHRYLDLLTLRTQLLASGALDHGGKVSLEGEVEGTMKVQLRIGDRSADLYLRAGSSLNVTAYDIGTARSLGGTSRMGIEFTAIDPLDVNALTSDLNERIDAFIAENLATDEAAGMEALAGHRKEGVAASDPAMRDAAPFVTPLLTKDLVDPFATKLRRFYTDVQDPWFAHYLEHGLAGLYIGPRMHERDVFDAFMRGMPVQYDDPEYVRLMRNLFRDALDELLREKGDSVLLLTASADANGLRRLFQGNDFLRTDDRLAELVMIDQLYLNQESPAFRDRDIKPILNEVSVGSLFPEHRYIAANMLWDLTLMDAGSILPSMLLEDERGRPVDLREHLKGPVCLAFTAGWCTYCEQEIMSAIKLAETYKGAMKLVIIGLDGTLEEHLAGRKGMPASDQVAWLHAIAEQQVRDDLRLRSLPVFYLLQDDVLARSPAPMPSKGLGEFFFRARADADKGRRVKVWDE